MRFFIVMLILTSTLLLFRGQVIEHQRNDLNTKLVASLKTVERLRSDSTSLAVDLLLANTEAVILRGFSDRLPERLTSVDFPGNPYPVPVIDGHHDNLPSGPYIEYQYIGPNKAYLHWYNRHGLYAASREIKL